MSYSPARGLLLVPQSSSNAPSLMDALNNSASNFEIFSSLSRIINKRKDSKASDAVVSSMMTKVLNYANEADTKKEEEDNAVSNGIGKVLGFIGRKLVQTVAKYVFKLAFRVMSTLVQTVLRPLISLIIRPILMAVGGFILSNPITAVLALVFGGIAWYVWDAYFKGKNTAANDVDYQRAQKAAAGETTGYQPAARVIKNNTEAVTVSREATVPIRTRTESANPNPLPNTSPVNVVKNSKLGSVSEREESGGRGTATVSTGSGDYGGVSYGKHQLASNNGSMARFLASPEGKSLAPYFVGLTPGTPEFNTKYLEVVAMNSAMEDAQGLYIKRTHYDVQVNKIRRTLGIDTNASSVGFQEAVFSAAVQYGPSTSVITNALGEYSLDELRVMPDSQKLDIIYKYKAGSIGTYFRSSDARTRASISKRIERERNTVVGMSSTTVASATTPTTANPVVVNRPPQKKDLNMANDDSKSTQPMNMASNDQSTIIRKDKRLIEVKT